MSPLDVFVERLRLIKFEKLLDSHPLVKHYKDRGFTVSYEGLAQHNGSKTEILDFSSDIDIALFFAMCPLDDSTNDYRMPLLSETHKGVIYMVNPMTYDPRAIDGNSLNIFEDLVQPIGLQPFERPIQKGYGIKFANGNGLRRGRIYDFEYTLEEAECYFHRYAQVVKLWVNDELVQPSISLSKKREFSSKIFSRTWKRFLIVDETKSQCLKKLQRDCGIRIDNSVEKMLFDDSDFDEKVLAESWNKYIDRVKSRAINTMPKDSNGKFVMELPCMRTEDLAHFQMLRMTMSGVQYPAGGRDLQLKSV